MCGIAGFVGVHPHSISAAALCRAADSLSHRGPDDIGVVGIDADSRATDSSSPGCWKNVVHSRPVDRFDIGLVHRRLSIIDTTAAGHQPMFSPDRSAALVFNGEIYNYRELREELRSLGHTFDTDSDTEVLLVALAEWGHAAVQRFIGMWAFAYLDMRSRKLLLCRDPFGIKPLYFSIAPEGTLAFASEPKAIHAMRGTTPTIDAGELFRFLRWGESDSTEAHLSAGIHQLLPGQLAWTSVDRVSELEPQTYWKPGSGGRRNYSLADAATELKALFANSIQLHLRSDVPLSFSLSGGIDSSAIVCESARQLPDASTLVSYSYIPDNGAPSEEEWIRLVEAVTPVVRRDVGLQSELMWSRLRHLVRVHDAPLGSSRIVAHAEVVAAAARDGFKVMLKGQGADELFAGYFYFLGARIAESFLNRKFEEALKLTRKSAALPGWSLPRSLAWAAASVLPESLSRPLAGAVGRGRVLPWIRMEWFRARGVVGRRDDAAYADDVLKRALVDSIGRLSLPHLLRYEDRNSMAYSLECRVPFLTTPLADFALSLPDEFLISADGWTKLVLREALKGTVPNNILWRRDKLGFVTPERDWVTGVSAEALLGPRADWRSNSLVNWNLLLDSQGNLRAPSRSLDAQQIFRCCALEMWMQEAEVQA
jgi:asparagine synthase (glutamine-hydrolysing)